MLLLTKSEIKKLDEWAIKEKGIPELLLMENAGRSVFQYSTQIIPHPKSVCVICGKGSNGGDGLVAARHFFAHGAEVNVFLLTEKKHVKGSAKTNLEIVEKLGINIAEVINEKSLPGLQECLNKADLVVDAIFGIGFSGTIDGIVASCIDEINNSGNNSFVVSVDIPSGMDPDTGEASNHCVNADLTITFTCPKKGFFTGSAPAHPGRLKVADIGIPKHNPFNSMKSKHNQASTFSELSDAGVVTPDFVCSNFPKRHSSQHKGSFGKILLIAGSRGMSGASILCSKACFRIGAGLVIAAVPKSIEVEINSNFPEVITVGLEETKEGAISFSAIEKLIDLSNECNVIAIGPGISQAKETGIMLKAYLTKMSKNKARKTIILDADALNLISDDLSVLENNSSDIIITPHPGEMARLIKCPVKDVQEDRTKTAADFSKKYNITVVLKGDKTVIASSKGKALINVTGNPGMASAGMGDVLTGIIAGLVSQNSSPFNAAAISVFVHGMSGDAAAAKRGEYGIIASDLLEAIPFVVMSILGRL